MTELSGLQIAALAGLAANLGLGVFLNGLGDVDNNLAHLLGSIIFAIVFFAPPASAVVVAVYLTWLVFSLRLIDIARDLWFVNKRS